MKEKNEEGAGAGGAGVAVGGKAGRLRNDKPKDGNKQSIGTNMKKTSSRPLAVAGFAAPRPGIENSEKAEVGCVVAEEGEPLKIRRREAKFTSTNRKAGR